MITIEKLVFVLTLFAALSCGLMAGVFFAFSTFVMKGLGRIPAGEGIIAMQSINFVVPGSLFGIAFILTPLICVITMILAILKWNSPGNIYIIIGGFLYLITNLLVTLVFNIPLNDSLAAIAPGDPNSAGLWNNYLDIWTIWNHVRTVGGFTASASFIIALIY